MEEQKICKHCNNKFSQGETTNFKWKTKVFCSKKCQFDYIIENNKEKGSWNKGLSWSEEIREKMSQLKKGITFNTGKTHFKKGFIPWNKGKKGLQVGWNKGKKVPQMTGENHPNWKGGITPENHKIRESFEYKYWRTQVFEKDSYTCKKCNKVGGKLVSHHIYSFNNNPDKRTLISNGITLCKECHKNFHHIYGNRDNTQKQLLEFLTTV